jgi:murein DD-endopeptidase MepM/ murein hydrolase activator NlpD
MALDIANRQLPDIFAAANGKVVYAGWDDSGYGNMILIDHGDGMKTRYAHNTQLYVSVGDYVTQGQSIAQMGSTGRSTGPHLHYEVIESGKLINPLTCY